jgi:hypothetical protein
LKEKKKGPAARKPIGPKRMTEIKRQLNAKKITIENQELLLKFDKDYIGITFDDAGAIMIFVEWLQNRGYHIIDGRIVFCFPFSRLVMFKNLK